MLFRTKLANYITKNSESKTNTRANFYSLLGTDAISFKKQMDFVVSNDRNICVCCSRRAGKTHGIVLKIIRTGLEHKRNNIIYVTDTRKHAKGLIWDLLHEMCEKLEVPVSERLSDLELTFKDTGSKVWLMGAETESEIKKVLGYKFRAVYIDEAQHFPPFLSTFCEERLIPALTDLQGSLILTGTPNETCSGYFYDCFHNNYWERHAWTWRDNKFFIDMVTSNRPELGSPDKILEDVLLRTNKSIDDAAIRRDWFGEWVRSENLFVYDYDIARNTYETLPESKNWNYIIGVDLGGRTGYDAVAVLGFTKNSDVCYLIEEHKFHGKSSRELIKFVHDLQEKYNPLNTVMDEGGLGSKTNMDYMERYGVSLEAAEKRQKYSYITMFNSELLLSNIKYPINSMIGYEQTHLMWDKDFLERGKYEEDKTTPNHLSDACLYAWRWKFESYVGEEEKVPPQGSVERHDYDYNKYLKEVIFSSKPQGWL